MGYAYFEFSQDLFLEVFVVTVKFGDFQLNIRPWDLVRKKITRLNLIM